MATEAGELLRDGLKKEFSFQFKGEVDIVTEMDRAAQDLIAQKIRKNYPGHGILAEEGLEYEGSSRYKWIVDPLDGTTNYAHRFPVFCISIGILYDEVPTCGVVHNPMTDETFTAAIGQGAMLNGIPIHVSSTANLATSLLGTGFPYQKREITDNNLSHFCALTLLSQGIRRCGSAALDLCFVACGRLDGFWELHLKPWDVAAGVLIVSEAGGAVSDFSGNQTGIDGSEILATNGHIHSDMAEALILSRPGQGED